MKLRDAIDSADRMRPNAVHPDDKKHALWELESQFAEMIGGGIPDWSDEDADPELIVDDPYSQVYVYSLMAFIDMAQQETDLYQLDAAQANVMQEEVKAFYRRHNKYDGYPQIKGVFI